MKHGTILTIVGSFSVAPRKMAIKFANVGGYSNTGGSASRICWKIPRSVVAVGNHTAVVDARKQGRGKRVIAWIELLGVVEMEVAGDVVSPARVVGAKAIGLHVIRAEIL